MPRRIAKPDIGTPTTSSAGAKVITPEEGTGATVSDTRNVARMAPPTAVMGKGTSKRWARKTTAAPWKSALPARYIEAPRGSTRSATGSETPRLPLVSSSVTGSAATVLVVAPIAATLAQQLGYRPDPFLMAVAVGAACDFLTPIGHQCNTLVMGPGGYRFSDYPRLGLPLSIMIVIASIPMLLYVWPVN